MNEIRKSPVDSLGYNFIPADCLPKDKDEYYLRNEQNDNSIDYRRLVASEIEILVRNRNTSDNWNHILVSDAFSPELVQDCKFFGLVRIGKLEPYYLEFHNLRTPVGLYNSTIISSDLGNNVAINNVNYLSHYIIGNDVIIVNTNELATTDHAKFGNGILKQNEPENIRIWLEVCNENAGRSIIPFDGMLPGDAWLWSRFRANDMLQRKLREFTEKKFDARRGYYGKIGDRTVIKNCKIIKDVLIGSDAYLKGANKLKNLTINSSPEGKTQIGEGCELVNGIVDYGCRIFYGVKAVRFILASNSQLKYGARLINSYLGNNSTISCCEVLNSLIFPAHEQHHNNSFLCASLVMGQSNMAAGATIGSNHNSRSADGELIAGRGFWPALCVSLKHNSKFASFILLAKGDYPAELNIPIPFSLVSNELGRDELLVMPAYWFLHDMYALARNAWKYNDRDKRKVKTQFLEFDFLAPDSTYEMVEAIRLMELFTGRAYSLKHEGGRKYSDDQLKALGRKILEGDQEVVDALEIFADNFEHSKRRVRIIRVHQAYHIFHRLIAYHAASELLRQIRALGAESLDALRQALPARLPLISWVNMGGQLVQQPALERLIQQIEKGKVRGWDDIHQFYKKAGEAYPQDRLIHALAIYREASGIDFRKADPAAFKLLLQQALATREWITKGIYDSRAKDYVNPFRKMVYEDAREMNKVTGSLDQNTFIRQEMEGLEAFRRQVRGVIKKFKL